MNKMMHSPEPMSLGSPTQSPPVNNQYLPQFLLGEMPSNNQVNFFFVIFIKLELRLKFPIKQRIISVILVSIIQNIGDQVILHHVVTFIIQI